MKFRSAGRPSDLRLSVARRCNGMGLISMLWHFSRSRRPGFSRRANRFSGAALIPADRLEAYNPDTRKNFRQKNKIIDPEKLERWCLRRDSFGLILFFFCFVYVHKLYRLDRNFSIFPLA
jgi:hypothetical protein